MTTNMFLCFCVFVPGQRGSASDSGRESPDTRPSLTSDDVHELHLRFQPHSAQTPLPWLRKSESHTHETQCSIKICCNILLGEATTCVFDQSVLNVCLFLISLWFNLCLTQIVCRSCSRNRYPLKYMKDRMAKVCDHCHNELKKRGGETLFEYIFTIHLSF